LSRRALGPGHVDGRRDPLDFFFFETGARGEPPGAVDDRPDSESRILGVGRRFDASIAAEDVLVPVAAEADIGVGSPLGLGRIQSQFGEFFHHPSS
jgi:hypothetical protein